MWLKHEVLVNKTLKPVDMYSGADMYSGNSWGVPSFKLTNFDNSNPYYQWGQDRIWLIENEIIDRLSSRR